MPGSPDLERRIKSLVRWNAAAMVVRANKADEGIGGQAYLTTFASGGHALRSRPSNHFFRGHGSPDARTSSSGFRATRRPFGSVCARLSRRTPRRNASRKLPPRNEGRRRVVVVSASVVDAGFLGVPDRVDGPRPDHGDLPGAVHALPRRSRPQGEGELEGVGVSRRRRDRTSPSRLAPSRCRLP